MAANTKVVLENLVDGYLAEASQIKGGFISVTTIEQRDALKEVALNIGSVCYVSDTSSYYTWNGTTWVDGIYTRTQTDNLLANKQDTLTSGTNIKTINNTSILGSGNIAYRTDLSADDTNTATTTAIRAFVNSSISASAANYVTSNAAGDNFATHAALTSATTYYHAGAEYSPKKNDYAMVAADEDHEGKQARYLNSSETSTPSWSFQYTVGSAFTAAQQAAIDSGITSDGVAKLPHIKDITTTTGTLTQGETSLTVNFNGSFLSYRAYDTEGDIILDTKVNSNNVVFSIEEEYGNDITCEVKSITDVL